MAQKANTHTAPPRYDETFKQGAVRMVTEQKRPVKEAASDLGICTDTLKKWLKDAGIQPVMADHGNRDARKCVNWKWKTALCGNLCPKRRRPLKF